MEWEYIRVEVVKEIKSEQDLKDTEEFKSWGMKTNNFLMLSQRIISLAEQSEILREYTTLNDDFKKRPKDENCKQDEKEVGEKRPVLESPKTRQSNKPEEKRRREGKNWHLATLAPYNRSHVISRKKFFPITNVG
ncbi:hypothetical protein RhiirA5_424907 [Rhizophagus irregularis]|uniref:Uncharacterized protein n=1 Tax=Rhizophagus irregularis TaxID=588596 RepID=A0A2I1DVK3_9GLOM|nr:hypothetical protein RhiirA5_424907 [Rhizophagus irregularis]PKC74966.1 hypothetical protein RhiirA1_449377 [Rhizophagus irregularis]PKY13895.1 hypothetical protein RhiirB3_499797 [Rhizophagus irregularis]CAB4488741.1 unnamed protein product [Rhizophagus irregularis]CAB5216319.1 unnamed protein product [Rhizophagus irregularis]